MLMLPVQRRPQPTHAYTTRAGAPCECECRCTCTLDCSGALYDYCLVGTEGHTVRTRQSVALSPCIPIARCIVFHLPPPPLPPLSKTDAVHGVGLCTTARPEKNASGLRSSCRSEVRESCFSFLGPSARHHACTNPSADPRARSTMSSCCT
jgi:hypothetical protein